MRIAFHRERNECYDQLVPVAYEAQQKSSLTLLQSNGVFRFGGHVFWGYHNRASCHVSYIKLQVSTVPYETEHTFGLGEDQIGNG